MDGVIVGVCFLVIGCGSPGGALGFFGVGLPWGLEVGVLLG